MSRLFVRASSQYLRRTTPILTATPVTLAAWIRPASLPAGVMEILCLNDDVNGQNFFDLGLSATSLVEARIGAVGAGSSGFAGAPTIGTWAHTAAVYASSTSRTAYLNGVAGSVDTSNFTPVSGNFLGTSIGAFGAANFGLGFDGDIAETAIWNVALSAADIAMLALGISPQLIRPDALVWYVPLLGQYSPEIDVVSHRDLTVTGATVSAHPRMFYPIVPNTSPKFGAALGTSGRTLAWFGPERAELPLTNFMTFATRNGHRVLEALAASSETAIFSGVMPRSAYSGGRISCTIYWMTKTATSGTSGWDISFERANVANHDLDSDAWVSIVQTSLDTVNGTSGGVMTSTVTFTPGADLESILPGDPLRLRIRSLAAGTATGNMQLLGIELKET
jgi:hypothetical protein